MKNDTFCCDTFDDTADKHNHLIVEFIPYEVDKQIDVTINMDDYNCSSPLLPYPPCEAEGCNNNFLLILLVFLVIRYSNLGCGKN